MSLSLFANRRSWIFLRAKNSRTQFHMSTNHPYQYAAPCEPPPCGSAGTSQALTSRLISSIGLIAIPAILLPFGIAFLYSLAIAPYMPPHDMRSLLGDGEVEAAYLVAAVLTLFWLACVSVIVARVRKAVLSPKGANN